jgi:hypothetical protein
VNPLELRYEVYKNLVATLCKDGKSHVMMTSPRPGKPVEISISAWDPNRNEYRAYTLSLTEGS